MARKLIIELFRHPEKEGDRLKIPQGVDTARRIASSILAYHGGEGTPVSEVDFKFPHSNRYRTQQALELISYDLSRAGGNIRNRGSATFGRHWSALDDVTFDEAAFNAWKEKHPKVNLYRDYAKGRQIPGFRSASEDAPLVLGRLFTLGRRFLSQNKDFFDSEGHSIHVVGGTHEPKLFSALKKILGVTGKGRTIRFKEGEGMRMEFEKSDGPLGYTVKMTWSGGTHVFTPDELEKLHSLTEKPSV